MKKQTLAFVLGTSIISTTALAITWPTTPTGESNGGKIGSLITADTVNSRIGIGTASPSKTLEVAGDILGSGTSSAYFRVDASGATSEAGLWIGENGVQQWNVYKDGTDGDKLKFAKQSGWAMTLDQSGNVGIGTMSPASILEIEGDAPKLTIDDTDRAYSVYSDGFLFRIRDESASSDRVVIDAAGLVGIGTATPSTALEVTGTVTATAFSGDGSALTGISAGKWDDATGGINYAGGNVGIGTTSPTSLLTMESNELSLSAEDVLRIQHLYDDGQGASGGEEFYLKALGTGTSTAGFNLISQWGPLYLGSVGGAVPTTGQKDLMIDTNGNVGIGTTSPNQTLDVEGTAYVGSGGAQSALGAKFAVVGSGGDGILEATSNGTSDTTWFVQPDANNAKAVMGTFTASDLALSVGNSEKVTILQNGNVGIGTTSPTGTLHVNGGTAAADTNGSDITIQAQAGGPDGGDVGTAGGAGGDIILLPGAAGAESTGGNVGIGTTNPGYKTDIAISGNWGLRVGTAGASQVRVSDNTIQAFSNDSTASNILLQTGGGNVGIGTSSPIDKLDVAGAGRFRASTAGGYGSGNHMVIDTSGTTGRLAMDTNGSDSTTMQFFTANSGTLGTRMTIDNDGNVGIGTTDPDGNLDIFGPNPRLVISNDAATVNDKKWDFLAAGGGLYLRTVDDTGTASHNIMHFQRSSGTTHGYTDFFTQNTVRMRIDEDGHVGIGTLSPEKQLHIYSAGDTDMRIEGGTDSFAGIRYKNDAVEYFVGINDIANNGTDGWYVYDTDYRLFIAPGGNVGIGTTSPGSKLSVVGLPSGTTDAVVSGSLAGAVCITDAGNMYIDTNGTCSN